MPVCVRFKDRLSFLKLRVGFRFLSTLWRLKYKHVWRLKTNANFKDTNFFKATGVVTTKKKPHLSKILFASRTIRKWGIGFVRILEGVLIVKHCCSSVSIKRLAKRITFQYNIGHFTPVEMFIFKLKRNLNFFQSKT